MVPVLMGLGWAAFHFVPSRKNEIIWGSENRHRGCTCHDWPRRRSGLLWKLVSELYSLYNPVRAWHWSVNADPSWTWFPGSPPHWSSQTLHSYGSDRCIPAVSTGVECNTPTIFSMWIQTADRGCPITRKVILDVNGHHCAICTGGAYSRRL
jgi:hypothetical protein